MNSRRRPPTPAPTPALPTTPTTPPAAAAASTRFPKQTPAADAGQPPGALIDARIAALGDWRGRLLARLRALIRAADPEVAEAWKWNLPVWTCHGIVCTGETYSRTVKLTFAKGASLPDPDGLFNASLAGGMRRAIDFAEGAEVDDAALTALVRAAAASNRAAVAAGAAATSSARRRG